MDPLPPGGLRPPRFAPLAESAGGLLRALDGETPDWAEAAAAVCRDPALCHALLAAAPFDGTLPAEGLTAAVAARLATLGDDLLRAWLLRLSWEGQGSDAMADALSRRALLTAECARHLALETRRAVADEAYLAGLLHNLGHQWPRHQTPGPDAAAAAAASAGPPATTSAVHAALAARLAQRCGLPPPVADAIEIQAALEELVFAAHPLGGILWTARMLAADDWQRHVDQGAERCGLAPATLLALRTDVAYLVAGTPAGGSAVAAADGLRGGGGPLAPATPVLRGAALSGLLRSAFSGLDADAARQRLAIAAPLLAERAAALVAVADDNDGLRPLALGADVRVARWFADLGLRVDDATSVVALSARSGTTAFHLAAPGGPARSAHDWQLARWLGGGFACLPLPRLGRPAVAVFRSTESEHFGGPDDDLCAALVTAAATAVLQDEHYRREQAALAERLEARYREHARRVAHEASNPLSVIKNYLAAMEQRHAADGPLRRDIPLIGAELDRIAALLGRLDDISAQTVEPAACEAGEVLRELHHLCGDSLFAARGIRFDVRPAAAPAQVAMPASALKQVLVNLFRNAAEALQPGGRLSVAIAGELWVDGRPCVEIRLIDNGPGLPPERLADPFAARPSAKGGEHRGVGLAMVREVLGRFQASILCRSQAGTGTSFQIFIPLAHSG